MNDNNENASEEEIERARLLYALSSNDNIEIDEEAKASRGNDGVWVAAWVFLPYE